MAELIPSLILASTSKPRQELLQRLEISFDIVAPNIDETPRPNESPEDLVRRLAQQKAAVVAQKFPDHYIIGADQVGILNHTILGKPHSFENAYAQLKNASGQKIEFFTGLCLYQGTQQSYDIAVERFTVTYRTLTETMIKNYLKKEQPFNCAGSCKAEGLGIALIQEFNGPDFTALIGLPLIRLVAMLEKAGLNPLI
jgi:MAF protein